MTRRGHFICGTEGYEEGFWLPFEILKDQLVQKYKFDADYSHPFTLLELLFKMSEILNDNHFEFILMTDKVPEDYHKNFQSLQSMEFRGQLNPSILSNAILFSNEPIYSLRCQIKISFKENLLLIIASVGLITFFYMQIRSFVMWCKYGQVAKSLYQEVVEDLKNVAQRTSGLSQSEILHKFL